jgi:hypothetical protein
MLIQKNIYIFILVLFSSNLIAKEKIRKTEFYKNFKQAVGEYEVVKGSSKNCSGGALTIVNGKIEKGIRLGQHMFIGPFDEPLEKESKSSCRVKSHYSFYSRSVVQNTILSNCPRESKIDEGVSVSTFSIEDKVVKFTVKESGFTCVYKKSSGVK